MRGPGRRPPGSAPKSARFRLRNGGLIVPVRLGRSVRRALVDTGAKGVVVEARIARSYPTAGRTVLRGVIGSTPTVRVRLPPLELLGRRFTDLTARVAPSGPRSPRDFDLILGTAVLLRRPLVLDFRRRRAWFEPGRSSPADEVHRLEFQRARPFLRVRLARKTLRATLDTGCSSCLLNARVRGIRGKKVKVDVAIDTAGKRSRWTSYRGPQLDLGLGRIGAFRFVRAPLGLAEKGLGRPIDFVIGLNVLRERRGIWTICRNPPELRWSKS